MEEAECLTVLDEGAERRRAFSFSKDGTAGLRSRSDLSSPPLPFLAVLVLTAAISTRAAVETSAAGSTAVDFFRPAVFLADDDAVASSLTFSLGILPTGNKAALLCISDPFLLFSFLDSRLFSFSLSLSFSLLLSFSRPLSASLSLESSSAALSLFLPLSAWGLDVNQGKRGVGLPDEKGSAGVLVCFLGLWLLSADSPDCDREWEGKVKVEFKALVARELTEILVNEEETEDCGVRVVRSEVLSLPLLVLMECEGDLGSDRMGLNAFLFRLREDVPVAEVPVVARLTDEGKVTDSKIREWASLGVNRGARSRGLLLCISNLAPECSEKRRVGAVAPGVEKPDAKPTSSGVSGGGLKLSNIGLRIRPSLAYFADEKYCGSDLECFREVHLNVGSLRIDFRFSCIGAAEAGRKGEANGMVGGISQGVWSEMLEAGCSGGGGVSKGGGGEEEDCCCGTLGKADSFFAVLWPKLLSVIENLLFLLSPLSFSGD